MMLQVSVHGSLGFNVRQCGEELNGLLTLEELLHGD